MLFLCRQDGPTITRKAAETILLEKELPSVKVCYYHLLDIIGSGSEFITTIHFSIHIFKEQVQVLGVVMAIERALVWKSRAMNSIFCER